MYKDWIAQWGLVALICWLAICLLDSTIHPLNYISEESQITEIFMNGMIT